jgi:putative transposase
MPRKKTILQPDFPYHISARCINKEWFDLDLELVWSIFGDYLTILKYEFDFEIISFVLMNNHFHLLVKTPKMNLSQGMNYFMREVSREISMNTGRINQTFGGPYYWCLLDSYRYFLNSYKYVYRNPVEAGLANYCESYHYSTLSGVLGFRKLHFPVETDTILFNPFLQTDTLRWLNTGKHDMHKHIEFALRKRVFRYRKDINTKNYMIDPETIY